MPVREPSGSGGVSIETVPIFDPGGQATGFGGPLAELRVGAELQAARRRRVEAHALWQADPGGPQVGVRLFRRRFFEREVDFHRGADRRIGLTYVGLDRDRRFERDAFAFDRHRVGRQFRLDEGKAFGEVRVRFLVGVRAQVGRVFMFEGRNFGVVAGAGSCDEGPARRTLPFRPVEDETVLQDPHLRQFQGSGFNFEFGDVDREVLVVIATPGDPGFEEDVVIEDAEAKASRFPTLGFDVVNRHGRKGHRQAKFQGPDFGRRHRERACPHLCIRRTGGRTLSRFKLALRRGLRVDAEAGRQVHADGLQVPGRGFAGRFVLDDELGEPDLRVPRRLLEELSRGVHRTRRRFIGGASSCLPSVFRCRGVVLRRNDFPPGSNGPKRQAKGCHGDDGRST